MTPEDLKAGCGGDAKAAEATFTTLQSQGVLNKYGRITDLIVRPDFALDAEGKLPGAVDRTALESLLHTRRPATIQVRVRGLHLMEGHVLVDGRPMSGSLL